MPLENADAEAVSACSYFDFREDGLNKPGPFMGGPSLPYLEKIYVIKSAALGMPYRGGY